MKNSIKRAVMFSKHVRKFFDTAPTNRGRLIPLPLDMGYLSGLLSMNRMRWE